MLATTGDNDDLTLDVVVCCLLWNVPVEGGAGGGGGSVQVVCDCWFCGDVVQLGVPLPEPPLKSGGGFSSNSLWSNSTEWSRCVLLFVVVLWLWLLLSGCDRVMPLPEEWFL